MSTICPLASLGTPLEAEFVRDHVWPLVATDSDVDQPTEWASRIAQSLGSKRLTVEYRFGDSIQLFAKAYEGAVEGLASYQILRILWEQGFGPASSFRVPQPVGYLAEHRVLLTRAAAGKSLLSPEPLSCESWQAGVTAAARWLAALHSSEVRVGPPEDLAQDVCRLAGRVAKAAAFRPELEGALAGLVRDLAARAPTLSHPQPLVQTHGRYHAKHVFVAPAIVTAIDLDRAGLANPAKDVAEFLHRLRVETVKKQLREADMSEARNLFMTEYKRHSPADLFALAYYWSYSLLSTLAGALCNPVAQARDRARVEIYHAEFKNIPELAGTLTAGD